MKNLNDKILLTYLCVCARVWRGQEREREHQVNTKQSLREYRPMVDFASIEPTLRPQCFFTIELQENASKRVTCHLNPCI